MKNFLKKNVLTLITVLLVIAIISLAFVAVGKNLQGNNILNKDDLEDTSNTPPPVPPTPEPPIEITYIPKFPKLASASESFLFTQSVCGIGDIALNALHPTTLGLYSIVTSSCKIGDIGGAKQTVGVTLTDSLGKIDRVFNIPSLSDSVYVASQIFKNGLVVITANAQQKSLFINVINYDLSDVKTSLIPYGENVRVYPTNGNFIIFSQLTDKSNGSMQTLIFNYPQQNLVLSNVELNDIAEIFEYGDKYRVFYNTPSSFGYCDIMKDTLKSKTQKIIDGGGKLARIFPSSDGFLTVENDKGLTAKKYDKDFQLLDQCSLGTNKLLSANMNQTEIYFAVSGALNGIVTLNMQNMTTSFKNNTVDFTARIVHDSLYMGGKFYLLATDDTDNLALVTLNNDISEVQFLNATTTFARLASYTNKTLIVAYNGGFYDYDAVNFIGLTA